MKIPTIPGCIDRRILINFTADPKAVEEIIPFPFRPKMYKSLFGIPSMGYGWQILFYSSLDFSPNCPHSATKSALIKTKFAHARLIMKIQTSSKDKAIVGICLIRLKNIKPKGRPDFIGVNSKNGAHRIAVEWDENHETKTGVSYPQRPASVFQRQLGVAIT